MIIIEKRLQDCGFNTCMSCPMRFLCYPENDELDAV